jgi:hypothetical protein
MIAVKTARSEMLLESFLIGWRSDHVIANSFWPGQESGHKHGSLVFRHNTQLKPTDASDSAEHWTAVRAKLFT